MRENTFDIPAYKFFVMKIIDGRSSHDINYYNFLIENNFAHNVVLIPFENVDGLEVKEVKKLVGTKEIVIVGGMYYNDANDIIHCDDKEGISSMNICNFNVIYFDKKFLNRNYNKSIDKICEKYMEKKYEKSNSYSKRMYRCFFERYQDGSYEETKKRIKRLEIGK